MSSKDRPGYKFKNMMVRESSWADLKLMAQLRDKPLGEYLSDVIDHAVRSADSQHTIMTPSMERLFNHIKMERETEQEAKAAPDEVVAEMKKVAESLGQ